MKIIVSVVIPTHNRKDILKKTLLSFCDQTLKEFEIIVSDDGSTDGTGEMIKELTVPYPIKHLWQENSGRSAARNTGIKKANGDIILFVDDHIIVDNRLIEEHVKSHKNLKGTSICVVRGRVEFSPDYDRVKQPGRYPGEQSPLMTFHTNNISVRKHVLQEVGGFDEDFTEYGFQDQELGYRIRKAGYRFKINPNAVGYIFSVGGSYEKWCDKARQAGRSAVLFYRKHPVYAFFNVGINPLNTLLYLMCSLNDNWWLRFSEKGLKKAEGSNNSKKIKKLKGRIKFFYFLKGMHEALFGKTKKPSARKPSGKKNILLVSHQADLSGAPISLYLLAKNLNKDKFHAIFLTLRKGPLTGKLKREGIETVFPGSLFQTSSIRKLIKDQDIDLVHVNTTESSKGAIAGKLSNVPVIWHLREEIKNNTKKIRTMEKLANKIIALSKNMKSTLMKMVPENKIEIIPNGIDTKDFNFTERDRATGDELVVGTIGSIEPRKGTQCLIEAAAKVQKGFPAVKFLIVGSPLPGREGYKKKMESLANKLGVQGKIVFTGQSNNIPSILGNMDIFVLPSLWEGMSRVILEAMASGKPVVSTNVGGTPEVVIDKETGLLVPPEDPEKLAEAIVSLIKDPSMRKRMGENGRRRIENFFTIKRHVDAVENLYGSILK